MQFLETSHLTEPIPQSVPLNSVMRRHQVDLEVLIAIKVPFDVKIADLHDTLGLEEVAEIACCWKVFQVRGHEELVAFVEIFDTFRITKNGSC